MNLYKNTFIIAFFTIISQALGVLRDKLLISIVGVGALLDIYNASFKIPDLIMAIFVSFVGITIVVPFLTSSLVKNDKAEFEKKLASLFVFFNGAMTLFSIIIILTLDLFLHKLFPAFSAENLATLSHLSKIMLIQPIMLGISNLLVCVAQTYKNFLYYAMAPVFYNAGIIIGIIFFYKNYGVYGLAYGVLLGALMHLFINSIFIFKNKIDINLVYFNFSYIKNIAPTALWRSAAFIILSLKQFIITIFAGFLGVGVISVFTFATNLVNMAVQFFATSYSVASFPILSEYFEKGENEKLKKEVKKNTIEIFVFSILFCVLAFVFAPFIVKIIYNDNKQVLELFYILILAIPFLNLEQYYARAMMAMHRVKLITMIQVFSFAILCVSLTYFYKMGYDYTFLAKAYLMSSISQVILLVILSRLDFLKKNKLEIKNSN